MAKYTDKQKLVSACVQPAGWLDETRKDALPSTAETAFLELALTGWRSTNSAGRKVLRDQFRGVVAKGQ